MRKNRKKKRKKIKKCYWKQKIKMRLPGKTLVSYCDSLYCCRRREEPLHRMWEERPMLGYRVDDWWWHGLGWWTFSNIRQIWCFGVVCVGLKVNRRLDTVTDSQKYVGTCRVLPPLMLVRIYEGTEWNDATTNTRCLTSKCNGMCLVPLSR